MSASEVGAGTILLGEFRLPLSALRDLEAMLASYGFHPVRSYIDFAGGGIIEIKPDKLFCLCCGVRVGKDQFLFGRSCALCDAGCQGRVSLGEFFEKHNRIGVILKALTT